VKRAALTFLGVVLFPFLAVFDELIGDDRAAKEARDD